MTNPSLAPQRIIPPADFPVTWTSPAEEHLPWTQDRTHAPSPVTPLSADIAARYLAVGASAGFQESGMPLAFNIKRVNTYIYTAILPAVPPERAPEAMQVGERKVLEEELPQLGRRWDEEWFPELRELLDSWRRFDLRDASDEAFAKHLDESLNRVRRLFHIHMAMAGAFQIGPSMFQDVYADLFGKDRALEAHALLQGYEFTNLKAGFALWDLSRKAIESSEVVAVIRETPANEVLGRLPQSAAGQAFLESFQSYLDHYGRRTQSVMELADPGIIENPVSLIEALKGYLAEGLPDPRERWNEQLEADRKLLVAARKRLESYPKPVRDEFERSWRLGREALKVREEHNYWIDQRGFFEVRQVLVELGRRIAVAGALDSANDVFYLGLDEALAAFRGDRQTDLRARVAAERAEMAKWREHMAPPRLGTDYGTPPPSPFGVAMMRFFGGPPPSSDDPSILQGSAASSGKVQGAARVVQTLEEASKLERGEILVAPTTSAPWTPLFAVAAAVVTDVGGPLSHCAIVAREYALPAVVGVGVGTQVIRTGQLIEVDGTNGTVKLL